MKYHYHIVTPFSRPQNFERLLKELAPIKPDWHLIVDDPPAFERPFPEHWIHIYAIPTVSPPWKMWRKCINWFSELLDNIPDHPRDNDRFLMLSDDTIYEPNFFDKVDAVDGEVVIVSSKRGDQIPPETPSDRAHGTNPLIGSPENMYPGRVDSQQIIMSGRLFRRINLPLCPMCDGMLIEQTVNDFPTVYLPETFVLFNYLEPGRWNGVAIP